MAQDQQQVSCPPGVWTQLTNSDAASITFQPLLGDIYIRYTTDATQPSAALNGTLFIRGVGVSDKPLTELVELVGAARVWAKPVANSGSHVDIASVYVDHA